MSTVMSPRFDARLLASGLTLAALSVASLPAHATDPLSYVLVNLDTTGLTNIGTYSASNGYAVGYGSGTATGNNPNAFAWNLTTGTRTALDGTGLTISYAYGATNGYAVGHGTGTATGNNYNAFAWNLTTGTRTALNSTGLTNSFANGAINGYAIGYGVGTTTGNKNNTFAWDAATGTRMNLQTAFLPAGTSSSFASGVGDDGTITGGYSTASGSSAYALVPFKATTGDTLAAEKTAKVTGNLTQTTGTTVINGSYVFVGGAGNNTYTLAGGTLQGTGSITGNLVNFGGILSPGNSPGTFTVNGDYTQGTGGVLNMELSDLTSFDELIVSGNAVLGGTLNLSFASTFPNNFPASFDLINAGGAISGFFSQVNVVGGLPSGATGYSFVTSSNGTGGMKLTLLVVPETGTGLLALLGSAAGMVGIVIRCRK